VFPVVSSLYAQWRARCGVLPILHDDDQYPPEALLQSVWQHQRLQRDRLKTLDGRPVRILHPGFRSAEGGPDFRGAVVQWPDSPIQTGDIEVDLRPSGWHAHGHDRNPAFRNVILHVIWEAERPQAGAPPLLPLAQVLDAPPGELSLWLGGESADGLSDEWRGQCCAPLRNLAADKLQALLHQAAQVRLRSKAAQFQARARQAGWDQALWEGLFRALGYKHNPWPFQRLAELRSQWLPANPAPATLQARLLGLSGLLPAELPRTEATADAYLRKLWDQWWRERESFADLILPRDLWRLHGIRPANHPQRRLALAAHWAARNDLPQKLERWCADASPSAVQPGALMEIFQVAHDDFWSWHCTFRSARLKREQPLLGAGRASDLAVNVVLPWLWSRAVEGKNPATQAALERRYFAWPAAEDNAVLKLARDRILGGASRRALPDAAAQQGLMQIVRDFCQHTNALCHDCKLPGLAREFSNG
jgi:hypothetical protein